ncbi:MAG TPA: TonB-dependent receptor [Caulobacteraceae bacterium]|nr:TonB-dependent receptor [Caulobacteraceae bacterium]
MSKRANLWASCGVAAMATAMGLGGVARAETVAAAAADSGGLTTLGELIVTAQKRSENLEQVPVAVSAYTSKERDLVGIETIQDLTNFTPGLAYSTSLDRAFVRGVGRQTNNLSTDPGVATYADGLYNSSVVAASGDSLFVDRVEVLRGPQGTLYGRNSIGGAINAISRRPTSYGYGEIRGVAGNYGYYNLEGAVSGPVNDNVRLRLAASRTDQKRGYYKNLAGGPDEGGRGNSYYVEGQADIDLSHDLNVWIKASNFGYDSSYRGGNAIGSYDYSPFPPGSLGPGTAFGFTTAGFTEVGTQTQNPGATNIRTFSTNTPEHAHLAADYNVTGQVTWHTPWNADVKYIGGYTTYRYSLETDFDNTSMTSYQFPTTPSAVCGGFACPPLTVFPTVLFQYKENKSYYSNEVDLASTGDAPLQWIAGFYQYHEEYDQPVDIPLPNQPQLATPANGPANPTRDIYYIDQNMRADSYAGFAQIDWKVTDTIKLTGGIRYNHDHKEGIENTRQLCFGLPACGFPAAIYGAFTPVLDITSALISFGSFPGVVGPPTLNAATGVYSRGLNDNWSAWTGTAGIAWTPDASTLAYAKWSRGYKSGGFNSGTLSAKPETAPESIDAFEIGGKKVFGRTLQVNAALFYYLYDGMQIPLSVQPTTGPVTTFFFNMDRVISYGAELETIWQPTPDLQIMFNYAYLHATIDKGCCFVDTVQPGLGNQDLHGQTVPQSPRNKISLNANYTFHLDPGNLNVSASWIWKDKTYDSIFNRPWYLAASYSQVDLRASFTDRDDRFTVIGFIKNATNAKGADNVTASLLGAPAAGFPAYNQTIGLIPPRTYGLELQVRFR